MSLLTKIFKGTASEITEGVGSVIDKIATSDQERLNAKANLTEIVTGKLTELASYQKEVLVTELSGTKLQRSWRPIVMLAFATIVVYSLFIAPAFSLPNTELPEYFWSLLEIGLGGYVIGRSVEKISGRVTKNIDLSLISKRKRKLQDNE